VGIAGTKNATGVCQREKICLHDALTFPTKYINKNTMFSKYEDNGNRKCKYV
jgi:hypothetical protein